MKYSVIVLCVVLYFIFHNNSQYMVLKETRYVRYLWECQSNG